MSSAAAKKESAEVVDLDKLIHVREALGELENLYRQKQAAAESFTEGCNRIGEKAGIDHKVLKKYIEARVKDKVEEFHHRAEQMDLLFNEL